MHKVGEKQGVKLLLGSCLLWKILWEFQYHWPWLSPIHAMAALCGIYVLHGGITTESFGIQLANALGILSSPSRRLCSCGLSQFYCQNIMCLKTGPVVRLKGRIVNLKLLSVNLYIWPERRKAGSVRKVKE